MGRSESIAIIESALPAVAQILPMPSQAERFIKLARLAVASQPQLADAEEVLAGIDRPEGAWITALVPNLRGAERAAQCRLDAVHTVVSASETHNRKNVNRSIEGSLSEFPAVFERLQAAGIGVEGGIATAFGCPFEGVVPAEQVARIARRYQELGAESVSLGDTTGMATPLTVRAAIRAIRAEAPGQQEHRVIL